MPAPAKDPRFPWTHVYMDIQTSQWANVVQAVKTCWSVTFQEEVLRSVTIRGFESKARCQELLARQAGLFTSAAKWDKKRSQ